MADHAHQLAFADTLAIGSVDDDAADAESTSAALGVVLYCSKLPVVQ